MLEANAPGKSASARYNAPAQVLHWLTVIAVFAILPVAWVMVNLPKDASAGPPLFFVHKSFGVLIFLLIIARLIWRMLRRVPPLSARTAKWEVGLANATHFLLYAIFIIMPVSGYIMSSAGGHPVSLFGLPLPALAENKSLSKAAANVHVIGQYAVYVLVTLHILGVAWHLVVRRDNYLARMLPEQINAE